MASFQILTVAQISAYLKSYLEENKKLSGIYISGEISDYRGNYFSGHLYFSLKDLASDVKINCVMFRSYAERLRFSPGDGMKVLVRCDVSFYSKNGACQLTIYDIQPDGIGSKALAFEQLKEKLEKEGLFSVEHKKSIPTFPEKIGVITSAQGAAIHDIQNVLERRWPLAKIVLTPSAVQGENAPDELRKALRLQESQVHPDVIIIGRGGGSSDDLSAFNDEALAREIFASETPIISAVGHEIDFSICDFVADLRAPTPSAAAELVAPDSLELLRRLDDDLQSRAELLQGKIDRCSFQISEFYNVKQNHFIERFLDKYEGKWRCQYLLLEENAKRTIEKKERALAGELLRLETLNPAKLLARSVCIPEKEAKKVRFAAEVAVGDTLSLHFSDGTLTALVTEKKERESL